MKIATRPNNIELKTFHEICPHLFEYSRKLHHFVGMTKDWESVITGTDRETDFEEDNSAIR